MNSDINHKSTEDLKTELKQDSSLKTFLTENEVEFVEPDIGALIQAALDKKSISKAELARSSGMSTVYLYQLLSGRRYPSRDRMLCLCIGFGCSLEEAQDLLRKSRFAELYVKVRRDAIVAYGLENGLSINEINDLLYENEEETLI